MPLTFPSHLAAVLPLKLWAPRRFDGVALAAGTVAPDVAYLTMGTRMWIADTHSIPALFWWCLPVALTYVWIFRQLVPVVAPYFPGRWSACADLGQVRYAWWITVSSVLVGAVTHIAWDWLTHTDRWLCVVFGIRWYETTGVPWWTVSDSLSTLVGACLVVVLLPRALPGRDAPGRGDKSVPVSPRLFWGVVAAAVVGGLASLPFLPASGIPAAFGVRILHVMALALLVGGLVAKVRGDRR
ncbi:DUF4184 family protein [Micromonospora foliorum]|uniref:DUF4184 family protein n=1 Tax=Micromonospora foliorum TaxID=2911210 RepID=UPI003556909C